MTRKRPKDPLAPRKAPLQQRSSATVDAIIEAAARILETGSFDGYTTNAVAELAGVSIGSLYQYFPNRDALTAALIERETAALLENARRAEGHETCAGVIDCLIDAAVEHQMRRPALARMIDFEEQRLPLGAQNRRIADVLLRAAEGALALDDAPQVRDRALAAQDVLAMVRGMIDVAGERRESDAEGLRARVRVAVNGYLLGMAAAV